MEKTLTLKTDGVIEITITNSNNQELHASLFDMENGLFFESEIPEISGPVKSTEDIIRFINELEWELI